MLKKIINNSFIGLGIGFIITTFCTYFIPSQMAPFKIMLTWALASIVYGGSSIVYDYLDLRLALASHLIVSLVTTFIASSVIISYYQLEDKLATYGMITLNFIIIYLIIYAINFFAQKQEAKKLNHLLTQKNHRA